MKTLRTISTVVLSCLVLAAPADATLSATLTVSSPTVEQGSTLEYTLVVGGNLHVYVVSVCPEGPPSIDSCVNGSPIVHSKGPITPGQETKEPFNINESPGRYTLYTKVGVAGEETTAFAHFTITAKVPIVSSVTPLTPITPALPPAPAAVASETPAIPVANPVSKLVKCKRGYVLTQKTVSKHHHKIKVIKCVKTKHRKKR